MGIVKMELDLNKKVELTKEQLKQLEEARNSPIVYDEDCPELTDAELKEFRRANP